MPPPAGPAILGGMGEHDDYADEDSAPSWVRLTEDRLVLVAGLVCAAVLLSGALLAAFLFGP